MDLRVTRVRRIFSDGLAAVPWHEYLRVGILLLKRRMGLAEFQKLKEREESAEYAAPAGMGSQ